MKLAVCEPESAALRRYLLRRRPVVASSLARTEVLRALAPAGADALSAGRKVLSSIDLVRISDRVLNTAGMLLPVSLRSLDAIHLATAQHLGTDLRRLVTYDDCMAEAGELLGIPVATPA